MSAGAGAADPTPVPPCRDCGCRHYRLLWSRPPRGGKVVRRLECRHCGRPATVTVTDRAAPFPERSPP